MSTSRPNLTPLKLAEIPYGRSHLTREDLIGQTLQAIAYEPTTVQVKHVDDVFRTRTECASLAWGVNIGRKHPLSGAGQ